MKRVTFTVPMMYADHHVVEVRRLLTKLSGIESVYASSGFQVVEVEFDDQAITEDEIRGQLESTGYLGELTMPAEAEVAASMADGQPVYFRHTAVHAEMGDTVSFAQQVPYVGRPLWPCPGLPVAPPED